MALNMEDGVAMNAGDGTPITIEPSPSNTRFAVLWALLFPVITAAIYLVPALDISHWSDQQTVLVIALANALSALVLAIVAHSWHDTAQEPVVVQGALSAVLLALFAVGNGFVWWELTQTQQNLVISFSGAVLLLLAGVAREFVFAPKSVSSVARHSVAQGMAAAHRKGSDGSSLPGAP